MFGEESGYNGDSCGYGDFPCGGYTGHIGT